MQIRILLLALLCCFAGSVFAGEHGDDFTLYLVRHAEKQSDGSRDPALTEAGTKRAQQLATWLQYKDIEDIWSSDYQRTRDTAVPLAEKLGLELAIYDPRDLPALAEKLLTRQHSALIVGHSNTTPGLARLLCECTIEDMDESEYDRLIVVSVTSGKTVVKTLKQDELF